MNKDELEIMGAHLRGADAGFAADHFCGNQAFSADGICYITAYS